MEEPCVPLQCVRVAVLIGNSLRGCLRNMWNLLRLRKCFGVDHLYCEAGRREENSEFFGNVSVGGDLTQSVRVRLCGDSVWVALPMYSITITRYYQYHLTTKVIVIIRYLFSTTAVY